MGLLLAGAGALLIWMMATGRLTRLAAADRVAIAIALLGAALVLSGKGVPGGVLVAGSAGYALLFRRRRKPPPPTASRFAEAMSIAEARELLGVGPDADETAIRAAHRRLIAMAHPDRGGTSGLAARINDARDRLLMERERL